MLLLYKLYAMIGQSDTKNDTTDDGGGADDDDIKTEVEISHSLV